MRTLTLYVISSDCWLGRTWITNYCFLSAALPSFSCRLHCWRVTSYVWPLGLMILWSARLRPCYPTSSCRHCRKTYLLSSYYPLYRDLITFYCVLPSSRNLTRLLHTHANTPLQGMNFDRFSGVQEHSDALWANFSSLPYFFSFHSDLPILSSICSPLSFWISEED